jgi:hypothetical protein
VANMVPERPYGPGGAETRRGTKHFAPGAKLYIIDWYAGGCERIIVVGQHRGSKRLVTLVIDVRLVENLRAKVCYQPAVIAKIKQHFAQAYSPTRIQQLTKEFTEQVCQAIPHWQAQVGRQLQPGPVAPAATLLTQLWLQLRFLLKN